MEEFMKYIYEFVGTFFLVLTIGMAVLIPDNAGIMAPIAIGSILAAMVYAGGHISGGHYNPAVSFAVYFCDKLLVKDLWAYWASQILAAICAGYLTGYLKGYPVPPALAFDVTKLFIAEFLFTFALCFVVLNVAIARRTKGNSFYGWVIGATVLAGAYAVGPISGAAFNPAVAVGATIMGLSVWPNLGFFFAANFLGSLCASLLFKAVEERLT
jgi:aquaporin Z